MAPGHDPVPRRLRRSIVVVLIMLAPAGCTSWRAGYLDGGPLPARVRVTLQDWSVTEVRDARVEQDTLLVGGGRSRERVAIPIRAIRGIQFRGLDGAKTVLWPAWASRACS